MYETDVHVRDVKLELLIVYGDQSLLLDGGLPLGLPATFVKEIYLDVWICAEKEGGEKRERERRKEKRREERGREGGREGGREREREIYIYIYIYIYDEYT